MELSLGLGSGFDMYDKQRKDEKHEIDDGTQIMTVTVKGRVIETISCEQSVLFFSNVANYWSFFVEWIIKYPLFH